MTTRQRRIGLRGWLVITGAGLLTAVILALVWLTQTESGLRWTLARAMPYLPPEVEISAVSGTLAGPITLQGVRYEDDTATVRADRLQLAWRPGLLLFGTLHVDRLAVDGLDVRLRAGGESEPGDPFELPEAIQLPLRIRLVELSVNDARLQPPGDAEPVRMDSLTLEADASGSDIQLVSLTASGPRFTIQADGGADMAESWPLTLDADWALNWPGLPALSGRTRLNGDRDTVNLDQHLDRPFALDATGQLADPLGEFGFDFDITVSELQPSQLLDGAPPGRLAGEFRLAGNAEWIDFDGRVQARETAWGGIDLVTRLRTDPALERLEIHRAELTHAEQSARVTLAGHAVDLLSEEPRVDLDLNWEALAWPLTVPEYVSESGRLQLAGHPDDYRLALSARLAWLGDPGVIARPLSGRVETRLAGDRGGARVEQLEAVMDDGLALGFSGETEWGGDGPGIDGDLSVSGLDPALVFPDWPGELALETGVVVRYREKEPELELALRSVSGTLLGEPLGGEGSMAYDGNHLTARDLSLRLGESFLRADGRIAREPGAEDSDLRFELHFLEPAGWPLATHGTITADGRASGRLETLNLALSLDGRDIRHGDIALANTTLTLDLQDAGNDQSTFSADAEGLRIGGETLSRLVVDAEGNRGDHRIQAQVEHAAGGVGISLAAGLEDLSDWSGRLIDLRLTNEAAGQWQLREATRFGISPEGGFLEPACLTPQAANGELCVSGDLAGDGTWQADASAEQLPLALLIGPATGGMDVQGSLNLNASAADDGEGVTAEGALTVTPARISQTIEGEAVNLLTIEGGEGEFRWREEAARGRLALSLADGGRLETDLALPQGIGGGLAGRLELEIHELGLLPVLVPEIGRASGRLGAGIDISGTLADPEFNGVIRLRDAELGLPDLGITAEAVNATVEGGTAMLTLAANARSADGDLQIDASMDRLAGEWRGRATVTGERFLAYDTPDARVRVSPDLILTISPERRVDVTGTLEIPWARITPEDISGTVQPSPDEVIIRPLDEDREEVAGEDWAVHSRVRTVFGDSVEIDAYGLTGRLTGSLTTHSEPGRLTRATGELSVADGEYEAWRQQLEIERGRLFYNDTPVGDPALDIRAVRRPQNVVVGVDIRGTLRQPELTLFSQPSMQQSEQLSYLLTGRSLTEGGEGDRDMVRQASLALQVAGGSFVGREIGDRFGVDTVTIESGETPDDASVVFGEYISPRLFISYGIGLFEGTNIFRIRYELSSRWFLEAQSGPRSGADFIYSLESD